MLGLARGAVCNLARGAIARRGLNTTRVLRGEEVHPGYKSIKPKQEKFGVEDGTPVHLKGGPLDSVLYGVTMALCLGALGWEGVFFYELAQR